MIKSTFYNLPEKKKQRVVEAIVDEFAAEDTSRVSINNIIKKADISRGSFYQYFDDKMDLVEVLIKYYMIAFEQKVNEVITVSRGDVFYTFEECFTIIAELGSGERDGVVFKKLFSNFYSSNTIVAEYISKKCSGFEEIDNMLATLSRKNLKQQDDVYFDNVTKILSIILRRAVREYFVDGIDYDTVKKSYLKMVDIVKYGACA